MSKPLSQEWLTHILDTIDEGIHAVDTDGMTIVYNAAAGRMDGLRSDEVVGKHVLDVFPSLGHETSTLMKVLRTGAPITNQPQTYTNVFGVKIHTVNTTLPIVSGGKVIGALEIAKDLTQVKNLAEQVIDLQAQVVGKTSRSTKGGNLQAIYQFSDIVTRDAQMQEVIRVAERAAQTGSPILVYGETGTGKELLVQAIHNASPRKARPFLALNCAALPASLLEGILFGTVRGSFTGAEDRPGMFELSDGGTLFLDEIQSLPLDLQAKLLRVLQEGEIMRVGDTRVRRLNVRVITATNQDPEQAMNDGSIRRDLYYRINVVRLTLPPLRDRALDVPLLTSWFIDKWNGRFGGSVSGIADEVRTLFAHYPWPGNVRELENTIEAVMNLVSDGAITLGTLPGYLRDWQSRQMLGGSVSQHVTNDHIAENPAHTALLTVPNIGRFDEDDNPSARSKGWVAPLRALGMDLFWDRVAGPEAIDSGWKDMQSAFEHLVVARTLEASGGNVKKAAAKLGIPRQTLQYRMKQLGL